MIDWLDLPNQKMILDILVENGVIDKTVASQAAKLIEQQNKVRYTD